LGCDIEYACSDHARLFEGVPHHRLGSHAGGVHSHQHRSTSPFQAAMAVATAKRSRRICSAHSRRPRVLSSSQTMHPLRQPWTARARRPRCQNSIFPCARMRSRRWQASPRKAETTYTRGQRSAVIARYRATMGQGSRVGRHHHTSVEVKTRQSSSADCQMHWQVLRIQHRYIQLGTHRCHITRCDQPSASLNHVQDGQIVHQPKSIGGQSSCGLERACV
jgi:hypothetical protein